VGWTVAFADGFLKFSSTGGGGAAKFEIGRGKRNTGAQKNNIKDHRRMTDYQIRKKFMPQFVRQVKTIMGPRDAQILALVQACEALISNQNFLLQNGI
jgi:hypothetical protein